MSIQYTIYGTLLSALEYFSKRLHSRPWDQATVEDKNKALIAATRIIDALNFKGQKTDLDQHHEFPRDGDTVVPAAIEQATYEIAISLLDGRDPDMELESLGISSQGIESVRTTYNRTKPPIEHLINGVPSSQAWRLLRPFLRDENSITLIRV